jgi:hypothetical protein
MKTKKLIVNSISVSMIVCWLGISAMAQVQKIDEPVATIASSPTEITFQPQVAYSRLVLTVAAPGGDVYRKEFEGGANASFKFIDDKGFSLSDGHYSYELRVIPQLSREARKALAASREKGNTAEVMQELQKSGQLPATISVQSGSFLIENGAARVGAPGEDAEPRSNPNGEVQTQSKRKGGGTVTIQDVVTADDVIIQGSACIGLDCVNNESFGFDTIRLKENNTRIKFDDTSTSAGFPANDWQLTANDSASGGANKFSIEDITGAKVPFTLTAGAPTNSLFVSSTGRVGLRTATPVLDLHITTGDTPAHRLEQTAAGGFTAQTWDIAGNEANFFVRDVTSGSRLPFRIRPGAPTSSIDVDASGNVGVGTASPAAPLHVPRTLAGVQELLRLDNPSDAPAATADLQFRVGSVNSAKGLIRNGFDGTNFFLSFGAGNPAGSQMRILGNGNVGIGTNTPAGRLDVNGSIFQRGVQLFADYVFEPTYTLESIEEHADFMWNNKHLPAVGERKVDEQGHEIVEIGARMRGLLEELEKAHIYISTLSERISRKDTEVQKLERQNAELAERLARIELMLSPSKTEKK